MQGAEAGPELRVQYSGPKKATASAGGLTSAVGSQHPPAILCPAHVPARDAEVRKATSTGSRSAKGEPAPAWSQHVLQLPNCGPIGLVTWLELPELWVFRNGGVPLVVHLACRD